MRVKATLDRGLARIKDWLSDELMVLNRQLMKLQKNKQQFFMRGSTPGNIYAVGEPV
jgi:hypothetical protein